MFLAITGKNKGTIHQKKGPSTVLYRGDYSNLDFAYFCKFRLALAAPYKLML